jgi:hypothetical protein
MDVMRSRGWLRRVSRRTERRVIVAIGPNPRRPGTFSTELWHRLVRPICRGEGPRLREQALHSLSAPHARQATGLNNSATRAASAEPRLRGSNCQTQISQEQAEARAASNNPLQPPGRSAPTGVLVPEVAHTPRASKIAAKAAKAAIFAGTHQHSPLGP